MPGTVLSQIPHLERLPVTQENLDYANLIVIDLAEASTLEGRMELAIKVRDAMSTQGFFCVINHGLTQTQNDRIFDVADVPFSSVSEDEKKDYTVDFETTGIYKGYKGRQRWHIKAGVRDQIDQYNVTRDVPQDQHPEAVRPLLPEIEDFYQFCHYRVLHPLLRLLALGLELPEETLVNMHDFATNNPSAVRFMKYYPRSEDEEQKTDQIWLKGHTDTGSLTILWSQSIAALQILSPDGKWRWVRHIENGLVINAGDAMEFLSGGLYKATIHRVTQPPVDQQGHARVGVIYFAKPNDDVKLLPLADSPVLQKCGVERLCDDAIAPTMEEWRKSRARAYGVTKLEMKENGIEEEVIKGVVVKHYN